MTHEEIRAREDSLVQKIAVAIADSQNVSDDGQSRSDIYFSVGTKHTNAAKAALEIINIERIKPLRDAAEELAGALEECKAQFLFYEQNHRAKPDHAKADTNKAYAEKCETALARYRAVKGEE